MVKIYVIHYDKLKKRKEFLEKQLEKAGITASWLIQKESAPYSKKEIEKWYTYDRKKWSEKCKIMEIKVFPRPLDISEISLTINHFKLIKKISKSKEDFALVLEDDVILSKNFKKKLNKIVLLLKKMEWDICFLDWCGISPKKDYKEGLIVRKDNVAWGAAAYIITKKSARKIMEGFKKFHLVSDEEIKYFSKKLNFKIFWVNPPLTFQGSINGKFNSSLIGRNKKGIRKFFNWRFKTYKFLKINGFFRIVKFFEVAELKIREKLIK